MKRRSTIVKCSSRAWRGAVLTVALATTAAAATGCIIVTDDEPDVYVVEDPPPPYVPTPNDAPTLEVIDTDFLLSAQPGAGVGVFVEYAAGGTWSVRTTCDNDQPGYECVFDINATLVENGTFIDSIDSPDLEGGDYVEPHGNIGLRLHAETGGDADRVLFHANPGAIVQFDVVLDGVAEGRYFYWVGNGVTHTGAPTNPIQLKPSVP